MRWGLPPRATFARTSGHRYWDGTQFVSVGANVPRIEDLNYLGYPGLKALLMQPPSTNALLYSRDLTNAYWAKTGCTLTTGQPSPSTDGNVAILVDQGASGGEVVLASDITSPNNDANWHFLYFIVKPSTNTARFHVKVTNGGVGGADGGVIFDATTGAVVQRTGTAFLAANYPYGGYGNVGSFLLANGWIWLWVGFKCVTDFSYKVGIQALTGANSGVNCQYYHWHAQHEDQWMTHPISTSGSVQSTTQEHYTCPINPPQGFVYGYEWVAPAILAYRFPSLSLLTGPTSDLQAGSNYAGAYWILDRNDITDGVYNQNVAVDMPDAVEFGWWGYQDFNDGRWPPRTIVRMMLKLSKNRFFAVNGVPPSAASIADKGDYLPVEPMNQERLGLWAAPGYTGYSYPMIGHFTRLFGTGQDRYLPPVGDRVVQKMSAYR
jgi:hypothetical protein